MRGAVLHAPGDVRLDTRDDPRIEHPTDAIIRLAATCVCGSDLWPYRGIEAVDGPVPMGHEYVGVIEEIGAEVTTEDYAKSSLKKYRPIAARNEDKKVFNGLL